jgi:hypothetical protein
MESCWDFGPRAVRRVQSRSPVGARPSKCIIIMSCWVAKIKVGAAHQETEI